MESGPKNAAIATSRTNLAKFYTDSLGNQIMVRHWNVCCSVIELNGLDIQC